MRPRLWVGLHSPEGVGQHVPAVEGVDGNSGINLASVTAENGAPVAEHHVSLEEETDGVRGV